MPRSIRNLILLAALASNTSWSFAAERPDSVQILGQFVQSNYAAGKCLKPDEQTLAKFNANFKIVSRRATQALMKQQPGSSEQQVSEQFKEGTENVQKQIDAVINASGCNDPRIQELLKRFQLQADLKL